MATKDLKKITCFGDDDSSGNVQGTTKNEDNKQDSPYSKYIDELCVFDDIFMRLFFQNEMELLQKVLSIIIGKKDLVLRGFEIQKNITHPEQHSLCLDAYGEDSEGKKYNLEIQRSNSGADPRRARYHSSMIDSVSLEPNTPFGELPETYVIFLTEHDYFRKGACLYSFNRYDSENDIYFNDGAHIIYVNGAYDGCDSEIGKLIHDFKCCKASEMKLGFMKERFRKLKETEEGRTAMSSATEKLMKIGREEGREEGIVRMIVSLQKSGISISEIRATVKGAGNFTDSKINELMSRAQATEHN